MGKNIKHNYIKKVIVLFFILCSTFAFPKSVLATEQSELEDKIESTINSVLQNYINNINLDKEVEEAVNEAIEEFFNNLDKEALENDLKDNIKSALQSNLYDIQTKFEEVIEEKTYEVTNNLLNEKVRQEIGNEIRNMVRAHNDSCYYEDEETGQRYLRPGAKLISDSEANNMVNNVVKYVNSYTTIGDQISSTIKNDTRDLESLPSIIKIIKVDNAEKAMAVDTDGDDIKIKLSENVCDNYKTVGNSVYSKTAFSLVIFPALLVVLTRMISNEEDSEISERRWYQIVEKKLEEKDIALKNLSLADGTLIDACQKIFEDPIAKAFEELVEKMERENED